MHESLAFDEYALRFSIATVAEKGLTKADTKYWLDPFAASDLILGKL